MKRSELRKIIREEYIKFNEAEEAESTDTSTGIDAEGNALVGAVKKYLPGIDISLFSSAYKALIGKKPLSVKNKAILADTFVALMKNNDDVIFNTFKMAFKKIN